MPETIGTGRPLSIRQFARELGVSELEVRRWIAAGRLRIARARLPRYRVVDDRRGCSADGASASCERIADSRQVRDDEEVNS